MPKKLVSLVEEKQFQREYWDKLDFPNIQDVSCIFTTYNRCPFDPKTEKGKFNPLSWSVKSIIRQRPRVNEIIIVDDASTDYTKAVAKQLKKEATEKEITLRYIRHKNQKGTPIGRNTGARHSNSSFLFFMDDDCVAYKYTVQSLYKTYQKMQQFGIKVGAVHSPVYNHMLHPKKTMELKKIGCLDYKKAFFAINFDMFPKEYLNEENIFIDEDLKLLKPVQTQIIMGVFLCSKKTFDNVGGFPDYVFWKTAAFEDPLFGCRLVDNGNVLFLQADPKAAVYHGMFGYNSKLNISPKYKKKYFSTKLVDGITYGELYNTCRVSRQDTGNRATTKEWYYGTILGFFVLIYKRNEFGALEWAKHTYKEFVKNNSNLLVPLNKQKIDDEDERQNIWYSAIIDGLKLVSTNMELGHLEFLKKLNEVTQKKMEGEELGFLENGFSKPT